MNKQIKIVKKWLADPDSVTLEELKQNRADAYTASAAYGAYAADAAYWAADAAAYAAADDADTAAGTAAHWVKRYEALENDAERIARLRKCMPPVLEDAEMCQEAADEIERLEADCAAKDLVIERVTAERDYWRARLADK